MGIQFCMQVLLSSSAVGYTECVNLLFAHCTLVQLENTYTHPFFATNLLHKGILTRIEVLPYNYCARHK